MRTKIILTTAIAMLFFGYKNNIAKSGIKFEKLSWQDALSKAESENKNVFVYFYADWCGQCKQLKRTSFKDKDVADYYNSNFINIEVDGESADGFRLRKSYDVDSYPTLVIVGNDGKYKTKTTGIMKPYILINFGRRIVP